MLRWNRTSARNNYVGAASAAVSRSAAAPAAKAAPTTRSKSAFTLIELLVTIGIIVLILAMAVPAYRFIVGTRSQDAAANLIEAMLAQARSHAIATEKYAGVAFFMNPSDKRVAMALVVERPPKGSADEDPYLNYKAEQPNAPYRQGQEATGMLPVPDGKQDNSVPVKRRYVVRRYWFQPPSGNGGPVPGGNWASWSGGVLLDFVVDGEIQSLPEGVGCSSSTKTGCAKNMCLIDMCRRGALYSTQRATLRA